MPDRTRNKRTCSICGYVIRTSAKRRNYVCASCRRANGDSGKGRMNAGYSSAAIIAKQVITFGTCPCCGRPNQRIVNGRCDDARFYGMSDIDPDLSARARRGKGGTNDFVRKGRA